MQNEQSLEKANDIHSPRQDVIVSDVLHGLPSLDQSPSETTPTDYILVEPKSTSGVKLRLGVLSVVAVLLLIGTAFAIVSRGHRSLMQANGFKTTRVALEGLTDHHESLTATSLQVNGQLQVKNSLVLTPSSKPDTPLSGQLYYDKDSSQLTFYNGQQFINLGSGSGNTTITTTNILTGSGAGVELQKNSPGLQQIGNFNISGIGKVGALHTTVVTSDGGTLYVNPVEATAQQQIAAGTPATVGLTSGSQNAPGPGWNNDLSATKVTMGSVGGTAKSISVFFTSGTGTSHVQVGLYDDDGNVPSKPGNLLATSAVVTLVPDGTTTLTIPGVNLAANATYWLAVNTDDATVGRTYNSGSKASCFKSSGFGFMPDPFGGCFFDNNVYTISLNYTAGAGLSGALSQAQFVLGATGQALFQNTADSTTAFQVQNASGTNTILNIDSLNGRISIGKATAGSKLDIAGGDINLSNGRSLRFGGLQGISASADGSTTSVTNFVSGGTVSAQADNFVIQDANASTVLLKADFVNLKITIGDPAGSNTPVVLYLANKNTVGDPVGSAGGGIYYNSTLASFRCFYSGFWHNCADVEPQHSFSLYDEFIGGQTSFTGQIGSLGWTAAAIGANGSLALNPATPAPSANRPGILRLQTPAVANQGTTLMLGDTSGGSMIIATDNDFKTAIAAGAASGQVLRIGLHNEATGTAQPTSGLWWEANPAVDPNWRYCYGDGATATCAASSVAITANTWVTLEARVTATGNGTSSAYFIINNTPFQITTSTIDTANPVSPALSCFATTGTAQNCFWDYFQLTGTTSATR